MKQYLNSQEKDNIAYMMALGTQIESVMPAWEKNLTSYERRFLKTALKFIENVVLSILSRVEMKEKILIMKRVEKTECICVPKERVEQLIKEYKKNKNEVCMVNLNMFYDLAEVAMSTTCNPCSENSESCKFKRMYQELEIPYYDEKNAKCPFMVSGEESCEQAL